MSLAEEILRQPSIVYVLWSLLFTRMLINNEKEQVGQGEIQNAQEKKSSRKVGVGAKSCAQGDKNLKEMPDNKCNKGNRNLSVRCHPVKLPACKKELKENLSTEGNQP